jgi:dihydroneopterin aldolase
VAGFDAVTDYVAVKDLAVAAVIGVHDWEREIEQTLVVSVDMAADVRTAAATDDLADALDYSAVARTIAAVLREGRFRLIETAAERVAERLLADFPLTWLRLELRKPIASSPAPAPVASPVTDAPTPASSPAAPGATSATPAPTPAATPAYTATVTIERTREIQ